MRKSGPGRESRGRRFRAALLLALIPGVAGILLSRWAPTESLEYAGLDRLFLLRGPLPPPPGVCVVAIDDDSYQELGVNPTDPWPRRLHAELIRTLAREGARAIAFDVLFEKARDPDQDEAFAQALADTGIVVLGSTVSQVEDPRFRQAHLVEPYLPFAAAAADVADVNLPTDRDGVIRWAFPTHPERKSLALAACEVAKGNVSGGEERARLIDYYGPARTVRTVSLYQALKPAEYLPAGFFRNKIVFVGLSQDTAAGPAAKDAFLTPFRGAGGQLTYGVEVHATLAANLIDGRRIDLLPPALEWGLLLLLPVVASLIFMALGPLRGAVSLLILAAAPWGIGTFAFTRFHLWLPVILPSMVQLPTAYLLSLVWYYLTTARERERIRRAFAFYLSPEMIERIAAEPDSLNLGGEEIVATALFTDIQGFTPIAETLTAPQTAALLNDYFSDVTRHIFAERGTLIKYIGDAVFAIWGAPVRMEDHATRAGLAALALARGEELRRSDGSPAGRLITRIGVHTGPMLAGNLGSAQRFDYTAIGDAVNLASRIEGLNKIFGTRALMSGETLKETGGRFRVRSLGRVRVVGRNEPVELFELLGLASEPEPIPAAALARFSGAMEDFTAGRFAEAAAGFREAAQRRQAEDEPCRFFLALCERYRTAPPADWKGIVAIESK